MSYKQRKVKNKVLLVIIIMLLAILLTTSGLIFVIIESFSNFFLPKADVFVGRVVWKDVNYYPVCANRPIAWVKDEVMGKAKLGTSTFVYSLQGDESWKNLSLGVSYGDNPDEVWIRENYQIPQDGEITSAIFVSHATGKEKIIYDNNLIKEIELCKQSDKTEGSLVLNGDYKWFSVYLCYDNCPIGLFEYDLLKFQNKVFICKNKISWDNKVRKYIASDLYTPGDKEVSTIDAFIEEYAN